MSDNLQKLYDMTKDELEQLKGKIRQLLACPSLAASGPEATAILAELKRVVGGESEGK